MKVAIVGAGLSGLCCAYELERHHIIPTLFEKEKKLPSGFSYPEAIIELLERPITDIFQILSDRYDLQLHPISPIHKIEFYSSKETAVIEGNLGFITARRSHENSLERQLLNKIQGKIIYNIVPKYSDLIKEYDYIVIATGDTAYTQEFQPFQTDVRADMVLAQIEGEFNPDTVQMWLNNDFAPKGYCYILPMNKTTALAAIGSPLIQSNIKEHWNHFVKNCGRQFTVLETRDVKDYMMGRPASGRIGNVFLIGNAGGFIMPSFGFGQTPVMLSGIKAARAIALGEDYDAFFKEMQRDYLLSLTMRRLWERMENHHFDSLVKALNSSLAKKIFENKRINFLKLASRLLAPILKE